MSIIPTKSVQILTAMILVYIIFIGLELPLFLKTGLVSVSSDGFKELINGPLISQLGLQIEESKESTNVQIQDSFLVPPPPHFQNRERRMGELNKVSGLSFNKSTFNDTRNMVSDMYKLAQHAWFEGINAWENLKSGTVDTPPHDGDNSNDSQICPDSIMLSDAEFRNGGRMMVIPCGLTVGSHITVVGKPRWAHYETDPKIAHLKDGDESLLVSQFMIEFIGLKTVEGEEPPKILHFNPRLKGDWSGMPVIEQNTCYRMQWGPALRCQGWRSKEDEEMVDGQVKCEKWIRDDENYSEKSETTWWLNQLIGRTKKVAVDWPYPFVEGKLFVLTVTAGLEGYHVNVDGKHATSFPYRTGFVLEDATGFSVNGDIDVYSIFASSLPTSHPSFYPQKNLETDPRWQSPDPSGGPVELFVGILSAGNHFAERMAVRKSWMQHKLVKSSDVIVRFFVALGRSEVNLMLVKEADYFNDIVIVTYMDHYNLVVLKTIAICEYADLIVAAKYIMKCDDDTFVRVDSIVNQVRNAPGDKSLYIGNMNYYHKPLREGKWAVTHDEWPEEEYPHYANGPGYVISTDIASFIISEFKKHRLRLFKMEDVSMGMWVEQFGRIRAVVYQHSLRFVQFGCLDGFYTAHYQSPRQMLCLWDKLMTHGQPLCCDAK